MTDLTFLVSSDIFQFQSRMIFLLDIDSELTVILFFPHFRYVVPLFSCSRFLKGI